MAKDSYKEKFKDKMAKEGADDPGEVKDKKSFFKGMDKAHQTDDEKRGDYSDSDSDGKKDKKDEARTRAGRLMAIHHGIEEDFYKSGKGNSHRNRKANGMGNVKSRKSGDSSNAGSVTSSRTSATNKKPGLEGGGKMSSGGDDLNWVS